MFMFSLKNLARKGLIQTVPEDPRITVVTQAKHPFRVFVQYIIATFSKPMMTSSNGNIFRVTGPLCGEFTGPGEFPAQRPVTRSFDVYFDLRPN